MDNPKPDSALLLLAHGSTENANSSAATKRLASVIRQTGNFGAVHCAYWKEEPSFRQVVPMIEQPEVFVVPHFISEGYFTREIIPRELELTGKTTLRNSRQFHYCDPVGIHPSMTTLLLEKATDLLPDSVPREETALIIAGHGTKLNKNSAEAIKFQVEKLRATNSGFAEVAASYMEEEPLLSNWMETVEAPHVVVIPFFISDGLHTIGDIPGLLGIEKLSPERKTVYPFKNRSLQYDLALGSDPRVVEMVFNLVDRFIEQNISPHS